VLPAPNPELALAHGLFSVRQAVAAGYSRAEIARQVRRGRWARLERGILIEAGRSLDPIDQLLLAVLRCPPGSVIAYRSAANVLEWDLLHKPAQVQLIVPRSCEVAEVDVRRTLLHPSEVTLVGVLPVTTPVRTALDIAANCDHMEAVVAIDSAYRLSQISPAELEAAWCSRTGMHGHQAASRAIGAADAMSGSVPESQLRVQLALAGLPPPLTQYRVLRDGREIARVDFAWPDARLVVEVDGYRWHSSPAALKRDHRRQNRLELAGWTVLRFTADDVRDEPASVVAEINDALA
jgi:hypothetical protein